MVTQRQSPATYRKERQRIFGRVRNFFRFVYPEPAAGRSGPLKTGLARSASSPFSAVRLKTPPRVLVPRPLSPLGRRAQIDFDATGLGAARLRVFVGDRAGRCPNPCRQAL